MPLGVGAGPLARPAPGVRPVRELESADVGPAGALSSAMPVFEWPTISDPRSEGDVTEQIPGLLRAFAHGPAGPRWASQGTRRYKKGAGKIDGST